MMLDLSEEQVVIVDQAVAMYLHWQDAQLREGTYSAIIAERYKVAKSIRTLIRREEKKRKIL